jgi:hypothetical protein
VRTEFSSKVRVAAFQRSGQPLTHERLLALVHYDEATGVFTWKLKRRGSPRQAGERAEIRRKNGYLMLHLDGVRYYAHRVAWFYVYGQWPALNIDHADLDRSNNRLANLREATQSQNVANSSLRRTNSSGFKGVYQSKATGRFHAQITVDGRTHYLGNFPSRERAAAAYADAASQRFGKFARGS